MATYNELEQRIKELKSRTGKGSISPRETFDLMDELLAKTKGVDMTAQPLVVVKSYETLALANADRNPINPATNKPLALGQLISITADGTNNAVYRLASLGSDGSPTWEKQAELGDMTNYAKSVDLQRNPASASSRQNNADSFFVIPDNKILIKKSGFRVFSKSGVVLRVRQTSPSGNHEGTDKIFEWDNSIMDSVSQFLVLDTTMFSSSGEAWIDDPGLFRVIGAEGLKDTDYILAAWYLGSLEESVGLIGQTVISNFNDKISIIPYYNNVFSFRFNNAGNAPAITGSGECSLTIGSFILLYRGIAYLVRFNSPKTLSNTYGTPGTPDGWLTTFSLNAAKLLSSMSRTKDADGYRYINITDQNFPEFFFSDNKLSGTYYPISHVQNEIYTKNDNLILLALYKREPIGGVLLPFYARYNTVNFRDRQYFVMSEFGTRRDVGIKLIGNTITFKHLMFYASDFGSRKTTYYQIYAANRIDITIAAGETLIIDPELLAKNAVTKVSLEQKDAHGDVIQPSDGSVPALKIVNYGDYNNDQLPVAMRRSERVYAYPAFASIFTDAHMELNGKMMLVPYAPDAMSVDRNNVLFSVGKSLFIYMDSPYKSEIDYMAIYIDIPVVTLSDFQTFVIDTTRVVLNAEAQNINKLSDVMKVVDFRNYSSRDIPVCHYRRGHMSMFPLFFDVKSSSEGINSVYAINKAAFLPYYFSVQETKHEGAWEKRLNILHISDIHIGDEDAENNLREAVRITHENNVSLSAVVGTGDLTVGFGEYPGGGHSTKESVLRQLNICRDVLLQSNATPLLQLGNHDANDFGGNPSLATTKQEQFANIFQAVKDKHTDIVFGDADNGRHYHYFDIAHGLGNVRIIMLDQLDHDNPVGANDKLVYTCMKDVVYGQNQMSWLCNVLNSTPAGFGIIICNHYVFAEKGTPETSLLIDGNFVQGWQLVPDIVRAWQTRTALNKTYNDTVGNLHITVNFDFSLANGEFICYLCGHTHFRTRQKISGYDQLMIMEDSSGQRGTVFSNFSRIKGSPTSNTFSILSIDRPNRKIYRTSYGAYKNAGETNRSRIEIIDY